MSQNWLLPDEVQGYISQWPQDLLQQQLRQRTVERYQHQQNKRKFPAFNKLSRVQSNKSWMLVAPEVLSFLQNLIRSSRAKRCLDLGTFTGMSALGMAQALGVNGCVVTCEIDPDPLELAQEIWRKAGVANQIELHLKPAADVMRAQIAAGQQFDLIFLDAQDRRYYNHYYELALQLLPAGGSLIIDNAFMFGHVMDPDSTHQNGLCVRELNQLVKSDQRVTTSLLPIADGVMWAVKSMSG